MDTSMLSATEGSDVDNPTSLDCTATTDSSLDSQNDIDDHNDKENKDALMKQLHRIMELKELHQRVENRLSWAKSAEEGKLKKAEDKIESFLLDESIRNVPKKPYLKKRSGLSRFYGDPEPSNNVLKAMENSNFDKKVKFQSDSIHNSIKPKETKCKGHARIDKDFVKLNRTKVKSLKNSGVVANHIDSPVTSKPPVSPRRTLHREVLHAVKPTQPLIPPIYDAREVLHKVKPTHPHISSNCDAREELQTVKPTHPRISPNSDATASADSKLTSFPDSEEHRELKLFEIMENIADHSSFCSTSSLVKKFVTNELVFDEVGVGLHSNILHRTLSESTIEGNDFEAEISSRSEDCNHNNGFEYWDNSSEDGKKSPDILVPSSPRLKNGTCTSKMAYVAPPAAKCQSENPAIADLRKQLNYEIDHYQKENKVISNMKKDLQNELNDLKHVKQNFKVHKLESAALEASEQNVKLHEEIVTQLNLKLQGANKLNEEYQSEIAYLRVKVENVVTEIKRKTKEWITNKQTLEDKICLLQKETERLKKLSKIPVPIEPPKCTTKNNVDDVVQTEPGLPAVDINQQPVSVTNLLKVCFPPAEKLEISAKAATHVKINAQPRSCLKNSGRLFKSLCDNRMAFTNGDIKEVKEDGTERYYYADSSIYHTTYPNGLEILEFPNGQVERRNPNGTSEIVFTNGVVRCTHLNGTQVSVYPDNTVCRREKSGNNALLLPNGQQEYHRNDYMKRIYPDGTTKVVYKDGSVETRYPNGRVRAKNKDGVLVHDSALPEGN